MQVISRLVKQENKDHDADLATTTVSPDGLSTDDCAHAVSSPAASTAHVTANVNQPLVSYIEGLMFHPGCCSVSDAHAALL